MEEGREGDGEGEGEVERERHREGRGKWVGVALRGGNLLPISFA
jgi:hypothetical protein